MTAIHQFVPTFEPGAIGEHIVELHRLLGEMGIASEVFAEHIKPGVPAIARSYRDYGSRVAASPDDLLLYHVSIGSPVADFLLARGERLVLDHHNITPARFFDVWAPPVAQGVAWGQHQLAALAARAVAGFGDSSFNAAELVALGCTRTQVAPILLDTDRIGGGAVTRTAARSSPGARWLSVGRLVPNKAQHDVIKAFAVYHRVYDGDAKLWLVGPGGTSPAYDEALRDLAIGLALEHEVEITGSVSPAELANRYGSADVYVSLSDHEGFLVPLLEAMHHRLPVVALAAGAVPETLGDGGLLLPHKEPTFVAAAIHRVVHDDAFRAQLVDAGTRRLADFALDATRARWRACIEGLLS